MTGLLGGGHAIYFDAATGRAQNLDCFVSVPGLGADSREAELTHLEVPFGEEVVHYAVGPASGAPGCLRVCRSSGSGTARCRGQPSSLLRSSSHGVASNSQLRTRRVSRCSRR